MEPTNDFSDNHGSFMENANNHDELHEDNRNGNFNLHRNELGEDFTEPKVIQLSMADPLCVWISCIFRDLVLENFGGFQNELKEDIMVKQMPNIICGEHFYNIIRQDAWNLHSQTVFNISCRDRLVQ